MTYAVEVVRAPPNLKVDPDNPYQVACEIEQLISGVSLPNWQPSEEIETTFYLPPWEFLDRIPARYRELVRQVRRIRDINYKRQNPDHPEVHYKTRARIDKANDDKPEIYLKIKRKIGSIKVAQELVRDHPVSDFREWGRYLTEEHEWIYERPNRTKYRQSYRIERGGRQAKIAFSLYDIWSTRWLTQLPWEADLEARLEDMSYFLGMLRIKPELTTSASFNNRENRLIQLRLTS